MSTDLWHRPGDRVDGRLVGGGVDHEVVNGITARAAWTVSVANGTAATVIVRADIEPYAGRDR